MEKPKIETKTEQYYDYHSVIRYIEQKYNIEVRDYLKNHEHFPKWLKLMKENQPSYPDMSLNNSRTYKGKNITKDEYDARFKEIHDQYKRYQTWCIKNPKPKYFDFWHWFSDKEGEYINNGSIIDFNIKYYLDSNDTPKWVKEILTLIRKEFKPMYEECYKFLIEW